MSALAQRVHEAVGDRKVKDVAQEWGVPSWVMYDLLNGSTKYMPRPQYLPAIAHGLGITVDELLARVSKEGAGRSGNGQRSRMSSKST